MFEIFAQIKYGTHLRKSHFANIFTLKHAQCPKTIPQPPRARNPPKPCTNCKYPSTNLRTPCIYFRFRNKAATTQLLSAVPVLRMPARVLPTPILSRSVKYAQKCLCMLKNAVRSRKDSSNKIRMQQSEIDAYKLTFFDLKLL